MSLSLVQPDQGLNGFSAIRLRVSLFFLIVFFIVQPSALFGQGQSSADAAVAGIVSDPEGKPLPYATVSVSGGKNSQTDEKGRYLIKGLAAGAREVRISLVGYQTDTK